MTNLNVSLVQTATHWEDSKANLSNLDNILKDLTRGDSDLILFPETFTTGFTNASENFAEEMDGPTVSWMLTKAMELNAVTAGSLIIKSNNRFYNRFVFAYPSGEVIHYDKKHLFSYAGEHKNFTAGNQRVLLEIKGWKIFPQVCYDLRFPVWSRNDTDYDLLIFVANWPSPRKEAWRSLLIARAIENQAYVLGVNRVGEDHNQLRYDGNSACIDFAGKRILEMDSSEGIQTVMLEKKSMNDFRSKFAFLKDRDKFSIE